MITFKINLLLPFSFLPRTPCVPAPTFYFPLLCFISISIPFMSRYSSAVFSVTAPRLSLPGVHLPPQHRVCTLLFGKITSHSCSRALEHYSKLYCFLKQKDKSFKVQAVSLGGARTWPGEAMVVLNLLRLGHWRWHDASHSIWGGSAGQRHSVTAGVGRGGRGTGDGETGR